MIKTLLKNLSLFSAGEDETCRDIGHIIIIFLVLDERRKTPAINQRPANKMRVECLLKTKSYSGLCDQR